MEAGGESLQPHAHLVPAGGDAGEDEAAVVAGDLARQDAVAEVLQHLGPQGKGFDLGSRERMAVPPVDDLADGPRSPGEGDHAEQIRLARRDGHLVQPRFAVAFRAHREPVAAGAWKVDPEIPRGGPQRAAVRSRAAVVQALLKAEAGLLDGPAFVPDDLGDELLGGAQPDGQSVRSRRLGDSQRFRVEPFGLHGQRSGQGADGELKAAAGPGLHAAPYRAADARFGDGSGPSSHPAAEEHARLQANVDRLPDRDVFLNGEISGGLDREREDASSRQPGDAPAAAGRDRRATAPEVLRAPSGEVLGPGSAGLPLEGGLAGRAYLSAQGLAGVQEDRFLEGAAGDLASPGCVARMIDDQKDPVEPRQPRADPAVGAGLQGEERRHQTAQDVAPAQGSESPHLGSGHGTSLAVEHPYRTGESRGGGEEEGGRREGRYSEPVTGWRDW